MDEEKAVRGGKNVMLSVAAVVILCIFLFPVFGLLLPP